MSNFGGFSKDILLFDCESTGFTRDPANGDVADPGDITQIGAVLLDKTTLEEKNSYLSDVRADPTRLDAWVLENTDITAERVSAAPERAIVAREFVDTFGTDVYLASWNVTFDRYWLSQLTEAIKRRETMYDYHHLDIWTMAYAYLCQLSHPEIIRSESTFQAFGQDARGTHNALDDCRRTAEILRAVVNKQELSL